MAASNSRQTRKDLARIRGEQDQLAQPQGYVDEGGAVREVAGDREGPHLKTPPFTEDPQLHVRSMVLSATEYTALPAIDTKQYRLLTLYLTYTVIAQGSGQLSIIPEKLALDALDELQWFTTSLVDPAVTTITPTGTRFALTAGFGSRFFEPAEFRWPRAIIAGLAVMRTMLTFDVSDADAFRLNVLENDDTSNNENNLSVRYARSQ